MPRLNLWHRLGIVLSVLWLLGVGYYALGKRYRHSLDNASRIERVCLSQNYHDPNRERVCEQEYILARVMANEDADWQYALRVAVIPIPVVWVLAYTVFWTVRWIWRGRSVHDVN